MKTDKKTLFRLPLDEVSNVKVLDKNEVTLEFHNDDLMSANEVLSVSDSYVFCFLLLLYIFS